MDKYDYLIIGGGIAGVTAAETIREKDPQATIGVISHESHILYSRVSIPSYIKKKIPREKLFLRTVDDFTKKRIDLLLESRVAYLDTQYKEVGLASRRTIGYGKLLIASGGSVRQWDQPIGKESAYHLQTLDDADKLFKALEEKRIQSPVVIGGSFIALEFLEIFAVHSLRPHLLVREPHFFGPFIETQGGELLRNNFQHHGVTVHYSDAVMQISSNQTNYEIHTKQRQQFIADAFALGIGVERNMTFLQGTNIELGERGVRVNEYLETNNEGIYAAGDVAEFYDVIMGGHRMIGNWANAFLQGKRAGLNMSGQRESFRSVSSYSITSLGLQITALGDCSNSFDTVTRVDQAQKQYERFFLRDGVLVGAFLINRFRDKVPLSQRIEKKTNVSAYKEQLGTFAFDIQNIPVVE